MAILTKRNGRWRANIRRSGLPPITKSFPTKAFALKWAQIVESNPEGFVTERHPEDHQLRTMGDLLRKYEKEVTLAKKGRDKEKYRLRILQWSRLWGVSLSNVRTHRSEAVPIKRFCSPRDS